MSDFDLHEQLNAFREIVDPEDHAMAGLGVKPGRGKSLYDTMMRQMETYPVEDGPKFPTQQSLEEADRGELVGWIAIYKGKRIEIKKSEADGIYGAKKLAAQKLKVPASKMGMMSISPGYEESVQESLTESENRSDAETVFFFKARQDALRVYSGGISRGLASGEITFDSTVEEKYGVGQFAVRFAPHVRDTKTEILYSLYTMAQGELVDFKALPLMFKEWLEDSGVMVVECGVVSPEMIQAGAPSKRLHLDYQGGRGNGHKNSNLAKAKRATSRFDRAAKGNASNVVDTSGGQEPVEGGKFGNKYTHPYGESDDRFAGLEIGGGQSRTLEAIIEGAYERAKKGGFTGLYFIVDTKTGKSVKGPFKGVDKADKARAKMGKNFQVMNKEYLAPQSYQNLEDLEEEKKDWEVLVVKKDTRSGITFEGVNHSAGGEAFSWHVNKHAVNNGRYDLSKAKFEDGTKKTLRAWGWKGG